MAEKKSKQKYDYQSVTLEKKLIEEIKKHIKQYYKMNVSVAEYVRHAVDEQMSREMFSTPPPSFNDSEKKKTSPSDGLDKKLNRILELLEKK